MTRHDYSQKSDELAAARRKKRRRRTGRRIAVILLLGLLVLLAALAVKSSALTSIGEFTNYLKAAFKITNEFPVAIKGSRPKTIKKLGVGFVTLSDGELSFYAGNGALTFTTQQGYGSPQIKAGNMRTLLFGRGSRELAVYNHSGLVKKFSTDNVILDADISDNGTVAALTKSDRYSAELALYRKNDYEKLFTWYEAENFPYSVSLSPNGAVAAAVSLSSENSAACSTVTLIDVSSASELLSFTCDGVAFRTLMSSNRVLLLTEDGMFCYDMSGSLRGGYEFGALPLIEIARDEGGCVALAFGDNSRSAVNKVTLLSSEAGEVITISAVGEVRDMYLTRDRVYILSDNAINAYNYSGELIGSVATDYGAICMLVEQGLVTLYPNKIEKLAL